jgi:transcriptional regulator with XRE-family HTH domain
MRTEGTKGLEARIGARVGIWRRRRSLTMLQLARLAAVHRNTIARVEDGGGCSAAALLKIAKALQVEIGELIPKAQDIVRKP